jgi:hypothetical protein
MAGEKFTQVVDSLYAFWEYDQPPYYCGGIITRMNQDGLVETEGFGKGSWFRPVSIVPIQTGQKIKEALELMQARHTQLQKDALTEARRVADALIKGELPHAQSHGKKG